MAGYVFGVGFLAFAGWRLWSHRVVDGAVEFSGTIVEEVARKSTQTGRRTHTYAPRVSYRHPRTGRVETYGPTGFRQTRFTVGEQTPLIHDPAEDRVYRPLDRLAKDTVVLGLVGIGFIAAQLFAR